MSVNGISNLTSAYETADFHNTNSASKSEVTQKSNTNTSNNSGVVYEPSNKTEDTKKTSYTKNTDVIQQIKAEAERRTEQFRNLVEKLLLKQGETLLNSDDIWQKLRTGQVEVDPVTAAQAAEDISENGYWGVEQTSDRIISFAKALTGGDPEKAEEMRAAFKKGYGAAEETWGGKLPDISQRTYDAVMKKFDDWANGTEAKS